MKVYISADIEGISGVVNNTHIMQEEYDYNRARKLMTDEVNAAIRGAKLAGEYNVPVVFVSGDNILSKQVKEFDNQIESLIVKYAHSRYTAQCIQPKKVHKLMEEKVRKSLSKELKSSVTNKLEGKIELEMTFLNSSMAEMTLLIPGVELIESNRIKYNAKDLNEAYKLRLAITTLAESTI